MRKIIDVKFDEISKYSKKIGAKNVLTDFIPDMLIKKREYKEFIDLLRLDHYDTMYYLDKSYEIIKGESFENKINYFCHCLNEDNYEFLISRLPEHITGQDDDIYYLIILSECYKGLKDENKEKQCNDKISDYLIYFDRITRNINCFDAKSQAFFLKVIIKHCILTKDKSIIALLNELKNTELPELKYFILIQLLYIRTGFNLVDDRTLSEIKVLVEQVDHFDSFFWISLAFLENDSNGKILTRSNKKDITSLLYYCHINDQVKIKDIINQKPNHELLKLLCEHEHSFIWDTIEKSVFRKDYLSDGLWNELYLLKLSSYIKNTDNIDICLINKYFKKLKSKDTENKRNLFDNIEDIEKKEIEYLMKKNEELIDSENSQSPINKQLHKLYLALYDYYMRKQDRKQDELKQAIFQSVSHTLNNILVVQNVTLHNTLANPESSVKKLLMYNEIISSIMKSIQLAFAGKEVIRSKVEIFKNHSIDRMSLYDVFWFCFALNFNQLLSGKGYWEAILETIFDLNNNPENFEIVEKMIKDLDITQMSSTEAEFFAERFYLPEFVVCNRLFKIDMDGLKNFYVEKDSYTFSIFFIIFLELTKNMFKYGFLNVGENKNFRIECKVNPYDFKMEFANNFNNSQLLHTNTLQGLNMIKLFADMLGGFEKKTLDTKCQDISEFVVSLKIEKGRVS